jgi:phosphate transport system permease protein
LFRRVGEAVGLSISSESALAAGVVMGVMLVPFVSSLSDDVITAVPQSMREGSLGLGATKSETIRKVILPAALPGIVGGFMLAISRAIGETMIVVMAAGNTPILDMNVFNGFRALSANIAVELPEAVKDGSLYRMLFLAALTLFAMTFVVNTVAELVRLRFRKRAAEL